MVSRPILIHCITRVPTQRFFLLTVLFFFLVPEFHLSHRIIWRHGFAGGFSELSCFPWPWLFREVLVRSVVDCLSVEIFQTASLTYKSHTIQPASRGGDGRDPPGSGGLWGLRELHSFSWPNRTPAHGYVTHVYPLVHGWAIGLLPSLGYYE